MDTMKKRQDEIPAPISSSLTPMECAREILGAGFIICALLFLLIYG